MRDLAEKGLPEVQQTAKASSMFPVPLTQVQQMYKGSFTFSASGTATIDVTATAADGTPMAKRRTFTVSLLKAGVGETITGASGRTSVTFDRTAITDDMVVLILPEERTASLPAAILGVPVTVSPAKTLPG